MAERNSLSKKTRFEIFKRDSFTCQYCGKSAPGVLLEVDHVVPVAKGGTDDIMNLVTSCFDCNRGKSDRELLDDTVIEKRKLQLDELQERREQIEMMMEWQSSLTKIESDSLEFAVQHINSFLTNQSLSDTGINDLRKQIARYGLAEILECTRISANQYLEFIDGKTTDESASKFIAYISKIAKNRKVINEKPYLKDLYRIKNFLKARGFYIGYDMLDAMESAYLQGHSIQEIEQIAKTSRNWSQFSTSISELINGE